MKSIRNLLAGSLLASGALLTAVTSISIATAADSATTTTPAPGATHGWHHHHGPWRLLSKLGLSAAQQASIKTILTNAHPQMQSLHQQMQANSLKLRQTQPTDPNYSSIVAQVSQAQGPLFAQLVTLKADLRAQVFAVLTPAQQAQLATLEAAIQAHKSGARGPQGSGAGAPTE